MKTIFLSGEIDELSFLEDAPNLEHLDIPSFAGKSLESLPKLPKILSIDITLPDEGSMSGIESLSNLETLFIHGRNIKDMSALKQLKNLSGLNFSPGFKTNSLRFLEGMTLDHFSAYQKLKDSLEDDSCPTSETTPQSVVDFCEIDFRNPANSFVGPPSPF